MTFALLDLTMFHAPNDHCPPQCQMVHFRSVSGLV